MEKFETVYATNFKGYFQTNRQTNHPSITNDRNVEIGYVKCNQVYNGESEFKNVEDSQFYRNSRSLPSKNKMLNSQITSTSTACYDSQRRLLDFNSLCEQKRENKRKIARSHHFSDCGEIVESVGENCRDEEEIGVNIYEYQKIKKINVPDKYQDFQNFKSENRLPISMNMNGSSLKIISNLKDAKLETSVHLQDSVSKEEQKQKRNVIESSPIVHKINIKGSRRQMQIKSKMQRQYIYMTPKMNVERKQEMNEIYTVKINKDYSRSYQINQQLGKCYESQAEEILRLKRQLEAKSKELRECKNRLEDSEKKNKIFESELQKKENLSSNNSSMRYVGTVRYGGSSSSYLDRDGKQLSKELGGSMAALLYLTLFMVLISKDVAKI